MAQAQGRQAQLAADIAALDAEAEVLIGSDPAPVEQQAADDTPPVERELTFKEKQLQEYAESRERAKTEEPAPTKPGIDAKPTADDPSALLREEIESLRTRAEKAEAEAEERASRAVATEREQYARERAERDAADTERNKKYAELEEAQRKAAIKLTAEEQLALVDKYGEDEAKDRQSAIEEMRQLKYDRETDRREMAEMKAAMNRPQPAQATQYARDTDPDAAKINESFAPFNEIAKPFGSWQSFTKSAKFKDIASDAEFTELFTEAFTRKDGLVVGVKPAIARAAQARLAELMKGKQESRPAPPLQSTSAKMNSGSVDDEQADDETPAEFAKKLRAASMNGGLPAIGKRLDQTLKRTIN
jgi:hypothetical protein